ncbi:hypothetical protein [Donghicola eburneus]|uniref:hypothetical protein n=1 Tax=Donghicola eburneus TaxID=393278 RepID=UPI0008E00E23|nr:hypothetical protein [Donghicola eburneus]SFQ77823.1 hypothetical protein SAMN05421764_12026 [Donghicola eburneus]
MRESKALPLHEFPRPFQRAIKRLDTPRRGRRRYSEATIKSTVQGFGQYLRVVQKAGLPLELSSEGLGEFIDNLDVRNLKSSTRLSYLTAVQAVAKETDYPAAKRRIILEDCEIYRAEMLREVPEKVRNLAARPISLQDIAQKAVTLRDKARSAQSSNRRRTYYQRSAFLAMLSLLPLRISDANSLVVGEGIQRGDVGWSLKIVSQKTGYRHNGLLHHSLTAYFDDLLLFGHEGSWEMAYRQRIGTPLFGSECNEFLSCRTLAVGFKAVTGHSPHIVRTLVHDALADRGTYGTDLARVLCGHRSIQISQHYQVYAERYRAEKAQKLLGVIQQDVLSRSNLMVEKV